VVKQHSSWSVPSAVFFLPCLNSHLPPPVITRCVSPCMLPPFFFKPYLFVSKCSSMTLSGSLSCCTVSFPQLSFLPLLAATGPSRMSIPPLLCPSNTSPLSRARIVVWPVLSVLGTDIYLFLRFCFFSFISFPFFFSFLPFVGYSEPSFVFRIQKTTTPPTHLSVFLLLSFVIPES